MSNERVEVITDMDNEKYHSLDSFSSSQIKDFINHPPAYFRAKYITKTLDRKETDAMKMGTATHTAWMEPEKFDLEYAVEPICDGRTKAGKEIKAIFAMESEGKIILTSKQGSKLIKMCRSLDNNRNARKLLKNTDIENSIFWTDQETGLDLRIRPDIWRKEHYIADLKTTRDGSIEGFSKVIYDFGYHISAAMYLDGASKLGVEIEDFIFICVESSPPYLTSVYTLSEAALEIGRNAYKKALLGLAYCIENNDWKGYNDDQVAEISLPLWVINRELSL